MLPNRCKRCLISRNYPGVTFDNEGICSYCNGIKNQNRFENEIKNKEFLREDFEKTIKTCKGKKYDCILGISGGKDSIYLLYLLKKEYKLNCLSFTVDNGLLSEHARENIEIAVNALGVDHIYYRPSSNFYKKFYKKLIRSTNGKSYMGTVCGACSEMFHSTGLRLAAENDIPLVLFAYSPDQVTKYFYEIPKNELISNRVPEILYSREFTSIDRSYFWNQEEYNTKTLPRVLFPFHVIPYPGIEKIESFLKRKKLIKVSSPLSTNCALSWLTLLLDLRKGYNPLELNYSKLVREGKAKRYKWLIVFAVGNSLLKNRLVKSKEIKKALNFLDLKLNDLTSLSL